MNAYPCCEPEGWQVTNACDAAESAIYEKLRGLFGPYGENLDECLERLDPPTDAEAAELIRDLRAEYRRRVLAETNRRLEKADV